MAKTGKYPFSKQPMQMNRSRFPNPGQINQGGQKDSGKNTSFNLPSRSTGTQKKRPGNAEGGLYQAQNPSQDKRLNMILASLKTR